MYFSNPKDFMRLIPVDYDGLLGFCSKFISTEETFGLFSSSKEISVDDIVLSGAIVFIDTVIKENPTILVDTVVEIVAKVGYGTTYVNSTIMSDVKDHVYNNIEYLDLNDSNWKSPDVTTEAIELGPYQILGGVLCGLGFTRINE